MSGRTGQTDAGSEADVADPRHADPAAVAIVAGRTGDHALAGADRIEHDASPAVGLAEDVRAGHAGLGNAVAELVDLRDLDLRGDPGIALSRPASSRGGRALRGVSDVFRRDGVQF